MNCFCRSAHCKNDDGSGNNECYKNQGALNKVCGADCRISAGDGVAENYNQTDGKSCVVWKSEYGVQKLSAGNEAGSCVNRKEKYDEENRDNRKKVSSILESVREELWNCD